MRSFHLQQLQWTHKLLSVWVVSLAKPFSSLTVIVHKRLLAGDRERRKKERRAGKLLRNNSKGEKGLASETRVWVGSGRDIEGDFQMGVIVQM